MLDRTDKIARFISFLESQAPRVRVTRRRWLTAEEKRNRQNRRKRKSRRLRKQRLTTVKLELPLDDVLAPAWCVKNGLPPDTPVSQLPMTMMKNDFIDLLQMSARRWVPSRKAALKRR